MKQALTPPYRSDLIRKIKNQLPAADAVRSATDIIQLLLPYDIQHDQALTDVYQACCNVLLAAGSADNQPIDEQIDRLVASVDKLVLTDDFQELYRSVHSYRSGYNLVKELYQQWANVNFTNFCYNLIDTITDEELNTCDTMMDHLLDWAIAYTDGKNSTTLDPQTAEKLLRTVIPNL